MARSLVLGATGGIGGALVAALRDQGDAVVALSRSRDGLDLTDEAAVARVLGALDGAFERVIIATGALEIDGQLPEKGMRAVTPAALMAQFALNAVGPLLVIKHAMRLLPKDRVCHVGVLSARVGSIGDNGLGGWYGYRAAKAALNQMIHTAAIEMGRSHPHAVMVLLHPGTVATGLTARYAGQHASVTPAMAAQNLLAVLAQRLPADSGGFYDWAGNRVPW